MSNPGIEATRQLAHMGYKFTLAGETIKAKYEGPGEPDPGQVKANKHEVVDFLLCYCPKCGGAVFGTFAGVSRCMGCYWEDWPGYNRTWQS